MKEIIEILNYAAEVVQSVERSVEQFQAALPGLAKQQMRAIIDRAPEDKKLKTTKLAYLDALDAHFSEDGILVVELDSNNWLVNALEQGVDGWDMKKTHLQSPKAKISKEGFRYLRIPLGKSKNAEPNTDKAKRIQEKIRQILVKPRYEPLKMRDYHLRPDGSVHVLSRVTSKNPVLANDPDLSGFYRVQKFASVQEKCGGKPPKKTSYLMFRTISEKPGLEDKWQHPGLEKREFLRELQKVMDNVAETFFEEILDRELEKVTA